MIESLDHKRSSKFKKIFCSSENNSSFNKNLYISPPILHHSTSIYSLVSPTRSSFNKSRNNDPLTDIYLPSSPPPPLPLTNAYLLSNSLSPMPRKHQTKKQPPKKPKDSLPAKVNPSMGNIDDDTSSAFLSFYTDSTITCSQDNEPVSPFSEDDAYIKDVKRKNRRHSCSSNFSYRHSEDEKNSTLTRSPTKLKDYSQHSRVNSTHSTVSSAAAISIKPSISRSTPLHKVKTYNVPKKKKKYSSEEDIEKERKMQELEDLIITRRERTLKLSLTPKSLT